MCCVNRLGLGQTHHIQLVNSWPQLGKLWQVCNPAARVERSFRSFHGPLEDDGQGGNSSSASKFDYNDAA